MSQPLTTESSAEKHGNIAQSLSTLAEEPDLDQSMDVYASLNEDVPPGKLVRVTVNDP